MYICMYIYITIHIKCTYPLCIEHIHIFVLGEERNNYFQQHYVCLQ